MGLWCLTPLSTIFHLYRVPMVSYYVRANIDIECLYLSLYHCNALVYENKES